jgi:hypothetical protein
MPTKRESIKLADRIGIPYKESQIHFITAYTEDYKKQKEMVGL